MPDQTRKLSEILKEMAEKLLRHPCRIPSAEAARVALIIAHVAWNEGVGLDGAREGSRHVWETIAAAKPDLWNEFRSNDIDAMIEELVRYKQTHFPDDRRRILTCGMQNEKVRVEWLNPAAPGVDSRWEMDLYGLVRDTRQMNRKQALKRIAEIVAELGLK